MPDAWRQFAAINPMAFVMDGMRFGLGGDGVLMNPMSAMIALTVSFIVLLSGSVFFARSERKFADII